MLKSETNFHGVSNLNKLSKRWLKHSVFFPAKLFETRCVPVPMLQVLQEFSAHDAAAFCWVGMSQIQRLQRGKMPLLPFKEKLYCRCSVEMMSNERYNIQMLVLDSRYVYIHYIYI